MSLTEANSSEIPAKSAHVSQYWERQFEKNRTDASLWTNNDIVTRHIYRLISGGSEEHWLSWFFNHYLEDGVVFERSLSVCCGDGAHELGIANTGRVRFIRGFDISEGAIAQANASFEKAAISKGSYAFEVADADDLQLEDRFDLILSTGALHHVTNLEGLLSRLSSMLAVNGYFVVLEYVGPNRFQWTDTQISVINGILRQLDPRYLKENTRIELGRPSIPDFMAIDPSEAVRSEDVLRLLPEYFTIEYLRNFNGTVMHPLYPLLDARLTNTDAPDFDSIVRMILWIEDYLIREKVLSSDFAFAICRSKERREGLGAAQAHLSPATRRFVGNIDLFDQHTIAGWAADTNAPSAPLSVDVYIDDRLQATLTADGFRQDLKDAGYGDGRKGFSLPLVSSNIFAAGRPCEIARRRIRSSAGHTSLGRTKPDRKLAPADYLVTLRGSRRSRLIGAFVIALAEVLLQPDVEANEEVAAAHFFYFQLWRAGAPVAPGDGERGPAKAADDGLERYLHRDVEMRGDERPAALDHFPAIGLKGVRRVVEFDAEKNFEEKVGQSIQEQFDLWIIDHASAFDEPAAKNAVVALVQPIPVTNDVARIVGFVRHHDDNRVATHLIEPPGDRAPKSVRPGILGRGQVGNPCAHALENFPGAIRAPVVHHDDLVRDVLETQLNVKMLHRGSDAAFFVARRDYN